MWSGLSSSRPRPINTELESISSSSQYRTMMWSSIIKLEIQRPTNTKTDQDRAKRQKVVEAAPGRESQPELRKSYLTNLSWDPHYVFLIISKVGFLCYIKSGYHFYKGITHWTFWHQYTFTFQRLLRFTHI